MMAKDSRKKELREMNYRDVQDIAKGLEIQANQSTKVLIDEILKEEFKEVKAVQGIEDVSIGENDASKGVEGAEVVPITVKEEIEEEIEVVGKVEDIQEEEVTLVANTTKPIEVKNVRVMLKRDHKCHVGGVWYTFKKDKQYNVPENVKGILKKSNLLLPL